MPGNGAGTFDNVVSASAAMKAPIDTTGTARGRFMSARSPAWQVHLAHGKSGSAPAGLSGQLPRAEIAFVHVALRHEQHAFTSGAGPRGLRRPRCREAAGHLSIGRTHERERLGLINAHEHSRRWL